MQTKGDACSCMSQLEVDGVCVRNVIKLDATNSRIEGHIERRIVQGPMMFVPDNDFWKHLSLPAAISYQKMVYPEHMCSFCSIKILVVESYHSVATI